MTKPPSYVLPSIVSLFAELGFIFHETTPASGAFTKENVVFVNDAGTTLLLERIQWSQTECRMKLLKGKVRHSGYGARIMDERYPQEFDIEVFKGLLRELKVPVDALLRQRRLAALLAD